MTEAEMASMDEADLADSRIYEAAFHIVSSLDDVGAATEAAAIRKTLESHGAAVMSEGAPMLMGLAYPIQKSIERVRHTFTKGYFGWFVFEASPEAAHAIKEMLLTRPTIIRSLLVKTVKEAADDRKHPALSAPKGDAPMPNKPDEPEAPAEEEKKPMDVEQVDAEIAKLVVE